MTVYSLRLIRELGSFRFRLRLKLRPPDWSGAPASSACTEGNRMYIVGGVTCAGCPIETPNVVDVGVCVSVGRPVVGPAPPTWVGVVHSFLFATVIRGGSSLT